MNYLSHVTNLVQIISYHYIFFKIHTIYLLFLAVPALRCHAGFSLVAVIKGCSLPVGSHCVTSLVWEQGSRARGLQELLCVGSVVMAPEL